MFKERFLRLNAALLEELLIAAAHKLHELIPGPAKVGILLLSDKGVMHVASIEVKDDSAPLGGTVRFLDSEGYETSTDSVPAWTSSDENVATLTVAEGGLSAEVAIGGPGVALIEVSSTDADTGADVKAQGTITVTPGDAVIGEVNFELPSEPAPEPAPEPEPTP